MTQQHQKLLQAADSATSHSTPSRPPLSPADEQRLSQLTAYINETVAGESAADSKTGAAARAERAVQLAGQLSRAGHSGRLFDAANSALVDARRRAKVALVGALSRDFLRAVVAACQRHRRAVDKLEALLKLPLAGPADAAMRDEVLGFRPVAETLRELLADMTAAEPGVVSDSAPEANRLRALCAALASVGAFDSLVLTAHLRPRLSVEFASLAESLLASCAGAAAYLAAAGDAAERVADRVARRYRPEAAGAARRLAAEALLRANWTTCVQLLAGDLRDAADGGGVGELIDVCRSLPAEFGAAQLLAEAALAAEVPLPAWTASS